MIDIFIYNCFEKLDDLTMWMDIIFFPPKKKKIK